MLRFWFLFKGRGHVVGVKLSFGRRAILLLNIILAQTFLVIFYGVLQFWSVFELVERHVVATLAYFYISAGGLLSLLAVFMLRSVVGLARAEAEAEVNRVRLQETREMMDMMRAQRHDFMNNLQVIYGLIQVSRGEAIKEYVEQINKEIQNSLKVTLVLNHRPEVAGLLMRKMAQAEAAGVSFSLDVNTDLMFLKMPPLDFTRVLGNLIDNALDAVRPLPLEQRRVWIEIKETKNFYEVKVNNFRPLIPREHWEKIFQKGFTTKSERGEGLGLYIVKTLVEKYHGKVYVESNETEGTIFVLCLPVVPSSSQISSVLRRAHLVVFPILLV